MNCESAQWSNYSKIKIDSGSEHQKSFLVRVRFEKSFIFGGHDNRVFISLNSECKISPLFQNINICFPVAQLLPVGDNFRHISLAARAQVIQD